MCWHKFVYSESSKRKIAEKGLAFFSFPDKNKILEKSSVKRPKTLPRPGVELLAALSLPGELLFLLLVDWNVSRRD